MDRGGEALVPCLRTQLDPQVGGMELNGDVPSLPKDGVGHRPIALVNAILRILGKVQTPVSADWGARNPVDFPRDAGAGTSSSASNRRSTRSAWASKGSKRAASSATPLRSMTWARLYRVAQSWPCIS